MKSMLILILMIPIGAFADFSGVYQGSFEKHGYLCKFDADLTQENSKTITLQKWITVCKTPDQNDYTTTINGPLSFTILDKMYTIHGKV
jgi:hypothetical protein